MVPEVRSNPIVTPSADVANCWIYFFPPVFKPSGWEDGGPLALQNNAGSDRSRQFDEMSRSKWMEMQINVLFNVNVLSAPGQFQDQSFSGSTLLPGSESNELPQVLMFACCSLELICDKKNGESLMLIAYFSGHNRMRQSYNNKPQSRWHYC